MTRILGIDPGSQRTGIGVVDVDGAGRCRFVHAQALVLLGAEDFPSRLGLLCEGLEALLDEWQPQQVAIETVFMDKSATSALKLGHARGAADKAQVQHMVRLLLNLAVDAKLQADAADALAVALTHAHMSATAGRTGVSTELLRRRGG